MATKCSVKVSSITVEAGTERTFQVTWSVSGSEKNHVEEYEWRWYYKPSKTSSFVQGTTGTTKSSGSKRSTYEPPSNAYQTKFAIRAKSKKKSDNKTSYFATTSWVYSSAVVVSNTVRKGYYDIGSKYIYTPDAEYPLSITVTPYDTKDTSSPNYNWCESFDVNWEFYVQNGNQAVWKTGEATTGIHRNTTTVVYTGVIPANFKKLRAVTKPTSSNSGVIAETKDRVFPTALSKTVRQVKSPINIFKYVHGDNTVMAEWTIGNDFGIESFICRFESKTEDSKYWAYSEESTIDVNQCRTESIYETQKKVERYQTGSITTKTYKVEEYVPKKKELMAEMLVNMGRMKAINYLVTTGIYSTKAKAEQHYNECLNIVDEMRKKTLDAASKVTESKTVTPTYGTRDVEYRVKKETKYWYSNEYTVPEGVTEVRVTITPVSAETGGYLEKPLQSAPFKFSIDPLSMKGSNVTFRLRANTRRTVIATWPKINSKNVDSYEYRWSYKLYGDEFVFSADSSGTISHEASTLYAVYEAGTDVKELLFEVKPVPKHANDFIGEWSSPATYSFRDIPKLKINQDSLRLYWPELDRTDKTLLANWNIDDWTSDNASKIYGYEIMWRYKIDTIELGAIVQEDTSVTINDKDVLTNLHKVDDKSVLAEFRIRPIPIEEDDFVGLWSEYEQYPFAIPSRHIDEGSLTVEYSEKTDRKLRISFEILDTTHVQNYTCRTQTSIRGVLSEPEEIVKSQNPFEIDAPNDADKIYIQIKPNDDSGNDVYFKGEYIEAVEYCLIPDSKSVENIDLYLQRGSKTTVIAVWDIDDTTYVDSYSYKWRYMIDSNVWIDATSGSTSAESTACTYDAPAQAKAVEIKVTPVAKYSLAFQGKESAPAVFPMPSATAPDTPAVPTLTIDKFTLKAMVDSYDEKASYIEFEIIDDVTTDETEVGQGELLYNRAVFMTEVESGYGYRARARALNDDGEASDWSEYTTDPVYTIPTPPEGAPIVNALSATSVEILWAPVNGARSYVIERTTKSRYFDAAPDLVEETTINAGTRAEIQGLEPKSESDAVDGKWFFRIKAVNDNGESEWGEIASIVLGTIPEAPTTWASSTTPITSDDVYLNWLHNSEDGSAQTGAILELSINGEKETHEFVSSYVMSEPLVYYFNVEVGETTEETEEPIEFTIDLSSVPTSIRSIEYGGITKFGEDGEYTDLITSQSINGSTLTFSISDITDIAGTTQPITISFFNENASISWPTEISHSDFSKSVTKIVNMYATTYIDVDISEIPNNQRDGITVMLEGTELKNESQEVWTVNEPKSLESLEFGKHYLVPVYGIPEMLDDVNHLSVHIIKDAGLDTQEYLDEYIHSISVHEEVIDDEALKVIDVFTPDYGHYIIPYGTYSNYSTKTVDLSRYESTGLTEDKFGRITRVEIAKSSSGKTHEYATDGDYILGECEFSVDGSVLTFKYPAGTDPDPYGPHIQSSGYYLWIITDEEADPIVGDISITATATAYTDNYEINGDTLRHYEYVPSRKNPPELGSPQTLTVSASVYHALTTNNFVLSSSGVSYYYIAGNTYDSGAVITWKVKTKGVMPDYGNWSVERQINIYTQPTVRFTIGSGYRWIDSNFIYREDNIYPEDAINVVSIDGTLETFPIILSVHSGPTSQTPIVYVVTIIANDTYDDLDDTGRVIHIRAGQEIYKRYIYTGERDFITFITASELNVDNSYSYTLTVTVNTDVGLTGERSEDFIVNWDMLADVELDMTLLIDEETAVAYLSPSCTNENGYYLNNYTLSVYRKDFDGGFTEIATDIPNGENISITDPHPSLDYARYRIVAISLATGRMFYEDLAPQAVGITDIIIQWDETWSGFSSDDPLALEEAPYKGSILRLPYNIDESESNDLDVELVNYIGRKHPVSYFGTHVGQTASWKTEIPKYDKETIYALRRLAVWPGDCYVRSPSGVGYWAHVKVNFDISHLEPIVPVSLDITRVEGGT